MLDWEYEVVKDKIIITIENGKKYFVKQNIIDNLQKTLKIGEFEAVEMWLEDNDILSNQEQIELDKKAKENKPKLEAKKVVERKTTTREKKANPTKELIISKVAAALNEIATDINIENISKIITFKVDNKEFKLDLTEKRVKKV